jgi:hypothetical protein
MTDQRETPSTEESARLEFVAGQVHALLAFALAVIETHPSPALLEQHLGLAQQAGLARAESTLLPDDFLDGQRDVMDRLQQRALRARERREGRNTRGPEST